jgi:hypothetical protein
MTKHSKGPWTLEPGSVVKSGAYLKVLGSNGVTVARVPIPEKIYRQPEAKADARLIAAAPDLLECLQEIVENKSVALDFLTGTLARAKAAIAKAKKG